MTLEDLEKRVAALEALTRHAATIARLKSPHEIAAEWKRKYDEQAERTAELEETQGAICFDCDNDAIFCESCAASSSRAIPPANCCRNSGPCCSS